MTGSTSTRTPFFAAAKGDWRDDNRVADHELPRGDADGDDPVLPCVARWASSTARASVHRNCANALAAPTLSDRDRRPPLAVVDAAAVPAPRRWALERARTSAATERNAAADRAVNASMRTFFNPYEN